MVRWMSVGAGVALALGLGAPRNANACEPGAYINQFWPAPGETFAADGIFFAAGSYLDWVDFVAKVDGEQIELELLDRFVTVETVEGAQSRRHLGLRPITVLEVGSTITIDRCEYDGCYELASWVVGEAAMPPSPVDMVHTALYSSPSCGEIGCTTVLPLHGAVDVFLDSTPTAEPRITVLRLRRAVAPFDEFGSWIMDGSAGVTRLLIASPFVEESPVADGLCLDTRTYDQAGNEILPSHVNCTPCPFTRG